MNKKGKTAVKRIIQFFGIGTLIGLMNFSVVVTTILAENRDSNFLFPFIYEMTGGYSFIILLPFILMLYKRFPLTKQNYYYILPLYLITFLPIAGLHTLFMFSSRQFIFNLAGWGTYDYGYIPYRFIMEYIKMFSGLSIAYLIYHLILAIKEKEKEKLQRSQLEEKLTAARLETLKSQLNPHFLFNTLNMISSVMYEDVKTADKMIANLSSMLRSTLNRPSEVLHSLKEELTVLNYYLEIMKARFNDKLKINFSIEEEALNAFIPSFMIQPLVENSIKYGMDGPLATEIAIKAEKISEHLIITITDNGPGIKTDYNTTLKKGLGMANTIERLEKTFNKDYKFFWTNNGAGLVLTIDIPYITGNANG
jgi:sensor histidine kinase YesM